jgi:hypothetical protein
MPIRPSTRSTSRLVVTHSGSSTTINNFPDFCDIILNLAKAYSSIYFPTYDLQSFCHSILCGQLVISSRPVIRYFAVNLRSPVDLSSDALRPTYDLPSTCHPMLCGQLMISLRPVIRCFAVNLWSPVDLSSDTLWPTYDFQSSCYSVLCSQLIISRRPVIRCFAANLWSPVVLSFDNLRPTYDLLLKAANPTTLFPYEPSGPDIYDVRMHLYVIIWMQNTTSSMELFFFFFFSIICSSFYATLISITLFTIVFLFPLL